MNIIFLVVLIWLAMLFLMLAFIRGSGLQEREAVAEDEADGVLVGVSCHT